MISKISFGSIFNPERTGRRNIEDGAVNPEHNLERLNAHQTPHDFGKIGTEPIGNMNFGMVDSAPLELFISKDFDNPEKNIEKLRYGQEVEPSKSLMMTPQELLGRCQAEMQQYINPSTLNKQDKELLSKLNFKKYGFYKNSNDFWFHSSTKKEDGTSSFALGDGKIQNGLTHADFVKELINENVQGFNITGNKKDGSGRVSTTFIHDKETGAVTIYSSDYNQDEACLECYGYEDFNIAINSLIDSLDLISGVTVWQ